MRHTIYSSPRQAEAFVPASASEVTHYPDDILPMLQSTLAALADLEFQFELARESLGDMPGSKEAKQRYCAELEQVHQQAREPYLQHLARLQEQGSAIRSQH